MKEISDLVISFSENTDVSSLLNEDNQIKVDWDEEVKVPEETKEMFKKAKPFVSKKEHNNIFLTGANGFLGKLKTIKIK